MPSNWTTLLLQLVVFLVVVFAVVWALKELGLHF